ncbi:MAG: response regulator [Asticcacaulis sp.]
MTKRLMDGGRSAEILLVDDNRGEALLIQHAFKSAEVETHLTIASTGEMALAILSQKAEYSGRRLPDLILLDMGLPMASGVEILNQIKTDDRLKHIPVIIMSNSGAEDRILKAYQLHANAYIVKPTNLLQFREAISLIERLFFILACLPKQETPA